MLKIIWDADNGIVLPDNKVKPFVRKIIKGYVSEDLLHVGAETIVLEFRISVIRMDIAHSEIVFIFENKPHYINNRGRWITQPPRNCMNLYDRQLMEVLSIY